MTTKTYVLSLDIIEQERYDNFSKKHYEKHKFISGVPVTFTPTGVGVHVVVKCPKCGKEKDISNYESW